MVVAAPSPSILTLTLRGAQVVLAIISLGLAAGIVAKTGSFDRVNYSIAISVLTLIYLVLGFIPAILRVIPAVVVLVFEVIFTIFWLAGFAATADFFGSFNCSVFDDFDIFGSSSSSVGSWCKMGKALIAIEVLLWLLFVGTLVLHIIYTVLPHTKASSFQGYVNSTGHLDRGFIYPVGEFPAANYPVDAEKQVSDVPQEEEVSKEVSHEFIAEGAVPQEHQAIPHESDPIVPAPETTSAGYPVDPKI